MWFPLEVYNEDHKAIIRIYLLSFGPLGYLEEDELQAHPFQVLGVLHPVDEVPADQLRHVGKGVVRAEDEPAGLLLAQDLLVALGAANVFSVVLTYEI